VQFPTIIGGVVPMVNIKIYHPWPAKLTARWWATFSWARITNWTVPHQTLPH
jgi:ABC-type phosphate transport system substrate-binding protein